MKNKKGISVIVGYVLLISITLALSVMVYSWLKFYVTDNKVEDCPNNANIIINGYECYNGKVGLGGSESVPGNLTIELKNKGLFTVDGYMIRVHDVEGAKFGVYTLNNTGMKLLPGEEHDETYYFNDTDVVAAVGKELHTVTIVEVQPFMLDENGQVSCQSHISQKTSCK